MRRRRIEVTGRSAFRVLSMPDEAFYRRIGIARRLTGREEGNVLVVVALSMAAILGFLAFALDVGNALVVKRQLQTAADAAAIAGALEIQQCAAPACSAMQTAAAKSMEENGLANPTVLTSCASSAGTSLALTVNNGPCALGASDPNFGNTSYVEAVVTKQQPLIFARIMGVKTLTLSARSEAGFGPPSACVIGLDPAAPQTILSNGNSDLEANCAIADDSESGTALMVNGHATLISTGNNKGISVVGGDLINGNPTVSPTPTTDASSVPDPFSQLPAPASSSCNYSNYSVNGRATTTLYPGTYCGLNINGGANVTLSPGIYVMNGNTVINGGSTLSGSGVMLYIASGQWIMNGGSHVDLVAQTTGTYAGILFFQSRTDNSQFIVNGDATSAWQGALYVPDGQLLLNGGSNVAAYTFVVADTILVNGNDTFTIGSDYSSLPGGPPGHGRVKLKE